MTKNHLAWVLVALVLAAPGAAAHGAAAPREVDVRVLLDDDGLLGYGGCGAAQEAGAPCTPEPEGLDVLALDVREAWLGDAPAIAFRMIAQSHAVHDGRGLLLTLTVNGTERQFAAASPDGTNFTSADFDLLEGPFDVFDGFPKAVDGWVRLSSLGITAGGEITGIHLDSTHHDAPDDLMPGTYTSNGVAVPHVPHDADPGEALAEHLPGAYTVKGPAPLLTVQGAPAFLDLGRSSNVTLRLGNPLAATTQAVTVTLVGPSAAQFASGAGNATVSLDAGATRDLTLHWPPGAPAENATVLVTSDLGGRLAMTIQVVPAPLSTTVTLSPSDHGKESPAPAAGSLLISLLALVALAARRLP